MRTILTVVLATLAACAGTSSMRPPLTAGEVASLRESTQDRNVVYVMPRLGREHALTDFAVMPEAVSGNAQGARLMIPLHDVYKVRWHETSLGLRRGMGLGLAGGVLGAIAILALSCQNDTEGVCAGAFLPALGIGAVGGTLLGGVAGAILGADRSVIMDSPPASVPRR